MIFWLLSASYWVHLIATVIWVGGLVLLALVALPAWQKGTLTDNVWLALQQRFTPWVLVSMVLLWVTGFVQMTNSPHYSGFLVLDGLWAWAMVLKHLAVFGMMGVTFFVQWQLHPAMRRLQLVQAQREARGQAGTVSAENTTLARQEARLLWLNLLCGLLVLLFTAIATAVS